MATIKGGDLMLFINGKSIGYATNHTLSVNSDTKEFSTKDNGGKWQSNDYGVISWSASTENLMSNDQEGIGYTDLVRYMTNKTPIRAVFTIEGDSPDLDTNKLDVVPVNGWSPKNGGYEGTVIITSIELNASNGENATFTVQFTGTGALYNRKWYLLKEDGTKTLIDNGATINVNAEDKYIIQRADLTYSNSVLTSTFLIPTTGSQVQRSTVYKKFSKAATISIRIEYTDSSIGYKLYIEEVNP